MDKVIRELTSWPVWVAGLVRYTVYRMAETRNVVGFGDLISV